MSIPQIWFVPVPDLLWSEYSGRPFERCIDCERPLLECDFHIVQKRFVAGEAVFELAMCHRCRESLSQECSQETMTAVTRFLEQHIRDRRRAIAEIPEGTDLVQWSIDHCLLCNRHRRGCHRYSVGGLCRGTELVAQIVPPGQTPLMICDDCEMGMADLVSKQTRDTWDRFVDEHFDGPPGVDIDLPSTTPLAF